MQTDKQLFEETKQTAETLLLSKAENGEELMAYLEKQDLSTLNRLKVYFSGPTLKQPRDQSFAHQFHIRLHCNYCMFGSSQFHFTRRFKRLFSGFVIDITYHELHLGVRHDH
ncbi:hypothetical protein [Bacillus licheniformis]|uniref:hypothetical protein n=1 Tax=Bacillus licheniformis TaxID=1402 RepID=UPI0007977720|nr:hypothetical protein [Bacillus licheniformis]KYC78735.1 hypothetical protein B4090_0284 [Bacillus licheniformis]